MNKILFINACVRDGSRTYKLAQHVLKKMKGNVTELILEKENIEALDNSRLSKRDNLIENQVYSDPMFKYAKQFADYDMIVIAAPYWDLSFPALLKLYIETICVVGITFKYVDGIPQGLCKAQKLIYVSTAGGQIGNMNYGFDYIKALSQNLFGIHEVSFVKAEGLDIFGNDAHEILTSAMKSFDNKAQ